MSESAVTASASETSAPSVRVHESPRAEKAFPSVQVGLWTIVTMLASAGLFLFSNLNARIDQLSHQIELSEQRLNDSVSRNSNSLRDNFEGRYEVLRGRLDALENTPDPFGQVATDLVRQRLIQLLNGQVPTDDTGGYLEYPEAIEWFQGAFARETGVSRVEANRIVNRALVAPTSEQSAVVFSVLERLKQEDRSAATQQNILLVANELFMALPD